MPDVLISYHTKITKHFCLGQRDRYLFKFKIKFLTCVVHGQVLEVHENLERAQAEVGDDSELDDKEKAIVREMCNVSLIDIRCFLAYMILPLDFYINMN